MTEDVVRLGLMAPLSGIVEMYGLEIIRAAKIACNEVNEAGGILGKNLEIVIEDDGSLPESAVKAAEKLVHKGCSGLVGNLLSNSRIAVVHRVAEPLKVPMLNFSFYEGSISSSYFFHFAALPNQQIDKMIPYVCGQHGRRMFFAGNNYEWPRGSVKAAKQALNLAGGEVVGEEYFPIGINETDIEKLLSAVEASGANVFVPYFAGSDQLKLLTRFAEKGLKSKITVVMGHFDEMMASRLAPEIRSGFYSCNSYFMTVDTPQNKNYLERLARLPGVTGVWPAGNGILTNFGEGVYLCVKAFAAAANKAGGAGPGALVAALKVSEISGPQGRVKIDPHTQNAQINSYLAQCRDDGKFHIIKYFGEIPPVVPEHYVSERMLANASLPYDSQLPSRIVDQMSEIVLIIDSEKHGVLFSNPSANKTFGYSNEEMAGFRVSNLFTSSGGDLWFYQFEDMSRTLRSKGVWRGNIFCTRKDGDNFWCSAAVNTFTHPQYGEVWMVVMQDLSGVIGIQKEYDRNKSILKFLEEKEKEQTKFYSGILNTMKEGFVVRDEGGKIIHLNKAACDILGLSKDQILGRTSFDDLVCFKEDGSVFPAQELPGFVTVSTGQSLRNIVMGVITPNNVTRWIKINSVPFDSFFNGVKTRALVTYSDISLQIEGKKAVEELQKVKELNEERRYQVMQAQRFEALGRLAGGVSHDFNNILSIITGCAETLDDQLLSGSQKTEVESILQATDRAARLTAQLLAYSRRQPLLNEKLDLNLVLNEMSQILHKLVGINVNLEIQANNPIIINSDRSQVEQIILNLVTNANEALLNRGGTIRIVTELETLPNVKYSPEKVKPGQYVKLSVYDNGVGIDEEIRGIIFEPFYSTKTMQGGTGLGLSTVHGIVNQFSGYIFVESKKGEFTRFSIYLPVLQGSELRPAVGTADVPQLSLKCKENSFSVLIAEDEPQVCRTLTNLFRAEGYNVVSALDGETALKMYSHSDKKIDLIITDYQMPRITGEEIISAISQLDENTKFILISGMSEAGYLLVPEAASRMRILRKPFRHAEILKAAGELLANS